MRKDREMYLLLWDVSSVQVSCSVMSDSLGCHGLEHTRLPVHHQPPEVTQTHGYRVRWWCHPTISSSAIPFPYCLQSFPGSGYFPMSQFFASGGQSIGVSASASIFPMNIQGWFLLGWTGYISLQSKGLSRVYSNTTVQKHLIFDAQLYSPTLTPIHDWKK